MVLSGNTIEYHHISLNNTPDVSGSLLIEIANSFIDIAYVRETVTIIFNIELFLYDFVKVMVAMWTSEISFTKGKLVNNKIWSNKR